MRFRVGTASASRRALGILPARARARRGVRSALAPGHPAGGFHLHSPGGALAAARAFGPGPASAAWGDFGGGKLPLPVAGSVTGKTHLSASVFSRPGLLGGGQRPAQVGVSRSNVRSALRSESKRTQWHCGRT
jgi:hypothetical protein